MLLCFQELGFRCFMLFGVEVCLLSIGLFGFEVFVLLSVFIFKLLGVSAFRFLTFEA